MVFPPAGIADLGAGFRLAQRAQNLLLAMTLLRHRVPSSSLCRGPHQAPLSQLIDGLLFGFWVRDTLPMPPGLASGRAAERVLMRFRVSAISGVRLRANGRVQNTAACFAREKKQAIWSLGIGAIIGLSYFAWRRLWDASPAQTKVRQLVSECERYQTTHKFRIK